MSELELGMNIKPITERFTLSNEFKNMLKQQNPIFGFNGLGEVVFRRTYSRDNEDWQAVVVRVVEGTMSIRKQHYLNNSLEITNFWISEVPSPIVHNLESL